MNKSLFAKIFFSVGIIALVTLVSFAFIIDWGEAQKIYNFAAVANIFTAFVVTSLLILVSAKEMD